MWMALHPQMLQVFAFTTGLGAAIFLTKLFINRHYGQSSKSHKLAVKDLHALMEEAFGDSDGLNDLSEEQEGVPAWMR